MLKLTIVVALATFAQAATPVEPALAQADESRRAIGAYIGALAQDTQFSGTVLVARGATIVFEQSYGKPDFHAAADNTPATLFAVASVTKPLTGIVARQLVARGVLNLDDPIGKWIPDFPNAARITVSMLLSHRAGIPHRVTQPSDEREPQTAESMTRIVSKSAMASEPGAQRLYSSAGYSVLARVLEVSSGKSYAQLLHELVLDPSGATTAVDATERGAAGQPRASGHFWAPDGPFAAPTKDLSFLVGAGSVWATPRDLFKVVRRVVDGGFGVAAAGARSAEGAVQWTGFSNGFFASVDYNPTTDITLIFTSNLLTGAADWISRDVPRLLAGDAVAPVQAPRPAVVALSDERRQQLSGLYNYFGNRQELKFLTPTNALLGGEYVLLAVGNHTFYAPQNYTEYSVQSDSAGNVTALHLSAPNGFSITRIR